MRTAILLLPLLAVAVPATASPDGDDDRRQTRAERQVERAERAERADRIEARRERAIRADSGDHDAGPARARARALAGQADLGQIEAAQVPAEPRSQRVQRARERMQDLSRSERLRQSDRPIPHVLRNRVPVVSGTPREGTQPPAQVVRRTEHRPNWSSSWRRDHRYDWYNWRKRNRSLFRLGFYYDPYGWSYRPYHIGWRLWPSYYGQRYWLSDPWRFRLPYAPPGYRWIRYWDDAVLVDTWTGEVVDVIHNFFW